LLRATTDNPPVPETDRLRGLVDAGIALSSELSLDDLLQKLVETAAGLTGARYAALGVIDESGTELERFLTTGIDSEAHAAIGELPRGRGILGVLITDATPLRLESIADDPRSVGFPPNHPPMRGFLGVPILLRGHAYGNLYLTEKAEGPFTAEDQELVETLASQAAVAIENARLYQDATNWSAQLEALNEVGTALAGEIELPRLLQLICRRLRGLISARVVTIALPAPDGTLRIEAADGAGADDILGLQLERAGSKSGRGL
jgi:GAF domain-containing protein